MAVPAGVEEIFRQLDANGSGFIELDELDAFAAQLSLPSAALMTQLDRDGDGKISLSDFAQCAEMLGLVPAEAAADDAAGSDSDEESAPRKPRRESLAMKAAKLFDQLDHDKSGSIDETELDIVLERLGLDDPEIRSKQVSRLMLKLDVDGDGDVSREEFLAAAQDPAFEAIFSSVQIEKERDELAEKCDALFDQLDADGSGSIGLTELDQMLERLGLSDAAERRQHAQTLMTDLDDDMSGEVDKEEFMKAVRRGAFDALFHPADNRLLADDEHDHGPTEIEHGQGKLKVDNRSLEVRRRSQNAMDARATSSPQLQRANSNAVNNGGGGGGKSGRGELTEEKLKHLHDIFNLADEDGTGSIGCEELMTILQDESITGRKLRNISEEYVRTVMNTIDTDGNGELDFDEFVRAFQDIITNEGGTAEDKSLFAAENKAMLKEMEELEARLKQSEEEANHLRQNNAHMLEEMQARLDAAQETAQNDIDRLTKDAKKMTKENARLKEDLKQARQTVEKLEHAMEDVKQEAARLEFQRRSAGLGGGFDNLEDLVKELEKLRKDNGNLEHKLNLEVLRARDTEEELRAHAADLQAKLDGYEKDIDRIDQLRSQIGFLEQSNEELRAEIEELRKRGPTGGEHIDFGSELGSLQDKDRAAALQAELDKLKKDTTAAWEQVQKAAAEQQQQAAEQLAALTARAEKAEAEAAALRADGSLAGEELRRAADEARAAADQAQLQLQEAKAKFAETLAEMQQTADRAEDARQLAVERQAAAESALEDFKGQTAAEWDRYRAQADADLAGLKDQLTAAQVAQHNAESELQALQAATKEMPSAQEVARLKLELDQARAARDQALAELANAKAEAAAERQRQADDAARELQRLRDEVEDHKTRMGIAAMQLEALRNEDADMNKAKLAEVDALKAALAKSGAALSAAEGELKRAQRDADDARRRAEELARAEILRLQSEADELKRRQDDYSSELEALKTAAPTREKELQELRARLAGTKTQLDEAEDALRAAKLAAADSAERLRLELQAELDKLRDERDEARRREAESAAQLGALQRGLTDKSQVEAEASARVQDLQQQREASLARLEAVDGSARALRNELLALQSKLASSEAEANALRLAKSKTERALDTEIQSLRDKQRRTQEEYDRVEAELERARRAAEEERQHEKDALNDLLGKARQEAQAARDRAAELEAELARLQRVHHRHMSGQDFEDLFPRAAHGRVTTMTREVNDETIIEITRPQLRSAVRSLTKSLEEDSEEIVEVSRPGDGSDDNTQASSPASASSFASRALELGDKSGRAPLQSSTGPDGGHTRCRYMSELTEALTEIEVLRGKLAAAQREAEQGQAAAKDRDARDLEITGLQQQLAAAVDRAQHADERVASLQQQVEAHQDEQQVLQGNLDKAKQELAAVRQQAAQAEKAVRTLQEQLRDLDDARSQAGAHSQRVAERDAEIAQLQADLEKLRAKYDGAVSEAEQHRQAGRNTQRDLRTLQGDHDLLQIKHGEAAAQLEQANEQLAQLRARVRQLEAQLAQLDRGKGDAETQAAAHQRALADRARELEALRAELDAVRRAHEDGADDANKAKAKERRMAAQLEELTGELNAARQRQAALERDLSAAQAEAAVLREQLAAEAGRLRAQLADAEAAVDKGKKDLANAREDAKRERDRAKAAADRELEELEAALASAKKRQAVAEEELARANERSSRQTRDRSLDLDAMAAGDAERLQRDLRLAREEADRLRAQEEDRDRQLQLLKRQLADARAQQAAADEELFDLRTKKARMDLTEGLSSQLAQLQTDLNAERRMRAGLEGELEAARQAAARQAAPVTTRTRAFNLEEEEEDEETTVMRKRASGKELARLEAEMEALRAEAKAAHRKREIAELELEHYRKRDFGDMDALRKLLDAAHQELAMAQREIARLRAEIERLRAELAGGSKQTTVTRNVTELLETSILKTENAKLRDELLKQPASIQQRSLPEPPAAETAIVSSAGGAAASSSSSAGKRHHHHHHTRKITRTEYLDDSDDEDRARSGGRRSNSHFSSSRRTTMARYADELSGSEEELHGRRQFVNLDGWAPGQYLPPSIARETRIFPVTIWDSQLAQHFALAQRPAWLRLGPEGLAVLTQKTHEPIVQWQLGHVKCYGMDRGVFSFELGRRSGQPGVIYLATMDFAALFNSFENMVSARPLISGRV